MSHYSDIRTSDDRTRIATLALSTCGMLCGVWSSLALTETSVSTLKNFAWAAATQQGADETTVTTFTGITAAAREIAYSANAAAAAALCQGDNCQVLASSSSPSALEGECAENSRFTAAAVCFGVGLSALAVASLYKMGCELTMASCASSAAAAAALGYAVASFYEHCATEAADLALGWHLAAVGAICHAAVFVMHLTSSSSSPAPSAYYNEYYSSPASRKFAQPPALNRSAFVNSVQMSAADESDPLSALGMQAGRQGVVRMSAATAKRTSIAQKGRIARDAARRLRIGLQRRKQCDEGRMRLRIFRSNSHMYAQIIDDNKHHTLVSASTTEKAVQEQLAAGDKGPLTANKDAAFVVGKLLAARAKEAGVEKVFFDRGNFKYHGRVAAVAEGAREGGLDF